MIKILLLFKKIHSTMLFLKSQLSPFALQAKIGCSTLCKLLGLGLGLAPPK